MGKLDGKRVAIIAMDGFEESELLSPREALLNEGAQVEVLSPVEGSIRSWKEKNWGNPLDVDRDVSQATADEYDAVMLPGGVINADHLRVNEDAVRLVSEFFDANKPVAAICHAPWTLIETDRIHGRRMTSYYTLKSDLMNAGVDWVDETAALDENLLTSRAPKDLPVFNERMIELFATWSAENLPERRAEKAALGREAARAQAGEGEPVAGVEPREYARPPRRAKKPSRSAPQAGRGTSKKHASRRSTRSRGGRRGGR
jgi:protease I